MERERVRSQQSPTRCPFCYEGIEVAEQEWVACAGCLGRHHASCWNESGSCSACQGTSVLRSEQAGDREESEARLQPGEAVGPPVEGQAVGGRVHAERSTEELHRLIEAHEKSSGSTLMDALLAYPTAGLYPLLRAEQRLLRNVESNASSLQAAGALEGDPRIARHAEDALDRTRIGAHQRIGMSIAMFVVSLLTFLLGIIAHAKATMQWQEEVGAVIAVFGVGLWTLTLVISIYLHWRAVRRHDAKQLYMGILARGLSEDDAKAQLKTQEVAWSQCGVRVFAFLAGGVLWPLSPLLATIASGQAMNLHEKREGEIEAMAPRGEATKADQVEDDR